MNKPNELLRHPNQFNNSIIMLTKKVSSNVQSSQSSNLKANITLSAEGDNLNHETKINVLEITELLTLLRQ